MATEAPRVAPKRGGIGSGVSMTNPKGSKRKATTSANGGQLKLADLVGLDSLVKEAVANGVQEAVSLLAGNDVLQASHEAEAQAAPLDEPPAKPVSLAQQCRDAIDAAKERHPKGGEEAYRVAAADLLGRGGPFLAKHPAGNVGLFLLRRPYRTALGRAFLGRETRPKDVGRSIEAEVAASALQA